MTGLRPPSTPRASLLPTPGGTPSALPTSARRRSAIQRPPSAQAFAANEMSSLRQAISANDPAQYASPTSDDPESPFAVGIALSHPHDGPSSAERAAARQPVLPGAHARTGSGAAAARAAGTSRPVTPSRSHTPTFARSRTPTGFGSSVNRFPETLRTKDKAALAVGAAVTFEVGGEKMEGMLRFIGEIEGKAGEWGGVELDGQYAGKGKNDGSVAGVQYFACPPACGLFLATAKITIKPKPKNPPVAGFTVGSRAAKYAGLSSKDLPSRRLSTTTSTPSARAAPRRSTSPVKPSSASPAKPRASLSPKKPLAASTTSMATPKPATRLARPSLGGAMSTPTAARRSLAGPSGTPRASMGPASIRRPGSSLRQHASAPEVPPIPSAYGLARSVTPSSGRVTPSTPGAMLKRRTSLAQSESSNRPGTPSARSYSRQSFASSVSRQSHRSTASTSHVDEELLLQLREDLEDAKQRETEVRNLLDASENLGREVEERLSEKTSRLKAAEERIALLEQERERAKQDEEARLASVDGEAGDLEREIARARTLEARVAEVEQALAARETQVDKLKLEDKHKTAAKEAEIESLRERLEQAQKAHEDERVDLEGQLDKLRAAGGELCVEYEEKLAGVRAERDEALELAELLQAQLDGKPAPAATSRAASPAADPGLSSSHASSAAAIDAENAQAELDHLRGKVQTLEEQLEDTRMQLEVEIAEVKKRRTRQGEVEALLKGEIKSLKEAIDRSVKAESRSAARIEELQEALLESQSTLEAERSELEGLRHDANGDASVSLAEDLKRVHKELASVRSELDKAQRDASLVSDLREDLRNAEKEIERLQRLAAQGGDGRRTSIGGKDDATATGDQIVQLKSIVETLTQENQRLGANNEELIARAEELADSQRALEATVENLMSQLDSEASPSKSSSPSAGRTAGDPSLRREVEKLKLELAEVQRRSEREIKALNQEVTELESLVESKIYHEDELEQEVERLRALHSSNGHAVSSSASRSNSSAKNGYAASETDGEAGEGECEMCGEKGHDLDSCPEFASSPTKSSSSARRASLVDANGAGEYCDDCEEYGHSLENCPLAAEIF